MFVVGISTQTIISSKHTMKVQCACCWYVMIIMLFWAWWSTYDAVEIHKLYPAVHEVIKMANDPHLCQLQHVHFWKVKYILMVLPLTF